MERHSVAGSNPSPMPGSQANINAKHRQGPRAYAVGNSWPQGQDTRMSNTKPATMSHSAPDAMRLAEMAESMSGVGHWRFDAISRQLHWSAQIFRIHGLDPAAGQPDLARAVEAFHPDDRALAAAHVETALNDGTPYAFDLRIVLPSGEVR